VITVLFSSIIVLRHLNSCILQVPVVSWFDDPSDRALLDLIPFFENLAKADDVYVFLGNDNLPSSTTMYIGSPMSSTVYISAPVCSPAPPVAAVSVSSVPPVAPIFSSSVQGVGDQACDGDVS
jgi:hypothetical protein